MTDKEIAGAQRDENKETSLQYLNIFYYPYNGNNENQIIKAYSTKISQLESQIPREFQSRTRDNIHEWNRNKVSIKH